MLKILLMSLQFINIILTGPKGSFSIADELKKLKETTGFLRLFSDEGFSKSSVDKGCSNIPLNIQEKDQFPGYTIFYQLVISAYFYDLTIDEYFFKNKENALNVVLDKVESSYGETSIITSVTNQELYEEYKTSTYPNRCKLTRKEINILVRGLLDKSCSVPLDLEKKLANLDQACSEKLKKVFETIKLQSQDLASNKDIKYPNAKQAVKMLFLRIAEKIINNSKKYDELKLRFLLMTEYLLKKGATTSKPGKDGFHEAREEIDKCVKEILATDLSGMTKDTEKKYTDPISEITKVVRSHNKYVAVRENMITTLIGELYKSENNQLI